MSKFVFNNIDSETNLGLDIIGTKIYTIPRRNIAAAHVYGRSGDVLTDEAAFSNVNIVYKATIDAETDANGIQTALDAISAMMNVNGYKILRDSYHPNEFRLAYPADDIDIEQLRTLTANGQHKAANFTIAFNAKPQRFLDSGASYIASPASLTNPTAWDAYPLIKTTGNGTVTIGTQTITIANALGLVEIDCETMDAYNGQNNENEHVSLPLKNITIPAGETVAISYTTQSLQIMPRWYKI